MHKWFIVSGLTLEVTKTIALWVMHKWFIAGGLTLEATKTLAFACKD